MIGTRIRQARLAAGLTLDALGEKVGVTHTAIQKYEKGLMTPPSSQLLKLARACGLRVEYFFRTHQVELLQPEFRKLLTFGKTAQEALKIKVVDLIEKRIELLGCFPESPILHFEAPAGLPQHVHSLDAIEGFADQLRDAWKLGLDAIGNLTDTLEMQGLLVIVIDEENPGFSGLTATARTADGRTYPIVAVSSRWSGERQRFTLAHELGHLLLAGRLAADLDEEKACDRFAGAFLAPKAAVLRLLGQSRRGLEWQEVYSLKHEFGLSMAGWLQRAKQCGVITEAGRLTLWKRFSTNGWRKQEPGTPVPRKQPRLFEQLVYRALAERHISESKAAELLGIPVMRFHKERQLETVDVAGFFSRAKDAARRADQGDAFEGKVTFSFEDPQRMFTVLSEARRRLMLEVMHEARSIHELSLRLHRNRAAIAKDVGLLEKLGLIVSERLANPGHGIQKVVRSVAPKIEVVTTLG